MPTIPEHLQIRGVDDLVATVGVLVVVEKAGVAAGGKLTAVGLVPAVAYYSITPKELNKFSILTLLPSFLIFLR